MSSPYVKLGNRSLDQWKVTELREELKKRKLTTKGLKEDLVKRLDEAVRTELENSKEDEGSDEGDANESELSLEQAKTESDVPGGAKEFMDVGISMDEKSDAKPENESDDHRSLFEGKVEVSLEQGTKAAELQEEHGAQDTTVETTVVINETVESVTAVSNNDGLPHAQEGAKPELSDPKTQLPTINESSTPVALSGGPNIEDTGTQDEALHSTVEMETDDPKYPQPDSNVQPLKYQVSEVVPDLGFQVTSDSVSTESVTIIEKNELKVDVITDNVQLELDVKHEMAQPLPSSAVPEEPVNKTDIQEPINNKDGEEPLDKKDVDELLDEKVSVEAAEMVDGLQNIDREDLIPEKLNLDRSSGDDSMEEDIGESKPIEYKSDSSKIGDNVENSGRPTLKEEDHVDVDVVGHDKPVETKPVSAENETASSLASVKRKFNALQMGAEFYSEFCIQMVFFRMLVVPLELLEKLHKALDKAPVGNSDPVKKARRWNAEGLKGSEPHSSTTVVSATSKGLSEPTFKPFSGTSPAVNEEAPKERIVPPSSKSPTNSLRIDRFLRPFTLKQVQELLGKTGTVTGFWMDHIKTHCYVSYSSVEEAVGTRNAVYNLQWPTNGGHLLVAEFVDPQEVKTRAEAPLVSPVTLSPSIPQNNVRPQPSPRQQQQQQLLPPPPPPLANPPLARDHLHREALPREQPVPARERLNLPPPPPLPEKVEPPIVTLDDLFRKTKSTPRIYYLPLSDEQVAAKTKAQGKNVVNHHQSAGVRFRMMVQFKSCCCRCWFHGFYFMDLRWAEAVFNAIEFCLSD
ncbi:apoptotic chromatin condensation inducer in the nucleus [Phtheirospermum japonicum]|uniref:Apoptotic chromatin condensation inducer in the nucleus n=1 Tax=Phtheirospermum japonicum TaxID=374723 RepID=A0A830CGB5_9LAMI|nr:apoptotic chromatin condensation inducer in the nucleus [Phtheirospermum japonicum]